MRQRKLFFMALIGSLSLNHSSGLAQQHTSAVAKSAFTTNIVDREPVNDLDSVFADVSKVYFFTDIRGMAGNRLTHRWLQAGKTRAEISFNIKGDRWRVYSSKTLTKEWPGEWKVEVVDSNGTVLYVDSFVYVPGQQKTTASADPRVQSRKTTHRLNPLETIVKAVFTTRVIDHEPVDDLDTVYTDVKNVTFFTDIRGMQGKTILHRWVYDRQIRAEIPFQVNGPRWRVHSSKNLREDWLGTWKVEVLTIEGLLLREREFIYLKRE
ncbi:MAG: DUF2914 domain-containing protein [bacterium]